MSEQLPGAASDPVEDYEELYENAPCGYLSLHPDGRIFKANATLAAWLKLPGGSLVGRRIQDLLSVAGRIYFETNFAPLVALGGRFDELALDLVPAAGERVPMLVNAVAKTAPGGEHLFTRLTLFNAPNAAATSVTSGMP